MPREDMPMKMRIRISQKFIVQFSRFERSVYGFRDQAHFPQELLSRKAAGSSCSSFLCSLHKKRVYPLKN